LGHRTMKSTIAIVAMSLANIALFALRTDIVWFLVLLGLQLSLAVVLAKSKRIAYHGFLIAIVMGIVARVLLIASTPVLSFDVNVYAQFADRMLHGELPYVDFYFPYPVLVAVLFTAVYAVFSNPIAFKVVFSIIDILNALLITRVVPVDSESEYRYVASAVYLLIPLTIIEASWSGHFESVLVLFMLLSLYYFLRNKTWKAVLALSIGSLVKYVPVGIAIGIFRSMKRRRDAFLILVVSGAVVAVGYLSMVFLGPRVTTLVSVPSSSSPPFFDYSFAAFFRIVTGVTGVVGQAALISIGGIFFLGILLERRRSTNVVPAIVKYSVLFVLLIMGVGMILYPFSSAYSVGYWRRLPELCIAQGVALLLLSLVIVSKWESISFTSDIHAIMFVLLLLMLVQPVFYPWYTLFLFPVALLVPKDEFRVFLVICLILYPTVSLGVFNSCETQWVFNEDISDQSLMEAQIEYNTTAGHVTNITVSNGILLFETNSTTDEGYATRISWNVSGLSVSPGKVVLLRMRSSDDPTFSKPFLLKVLGGRFNSTSGLYDEYSLISTVLFISNMSMLCYRYRIIVDEAFSPDYVTLQIGVARNITGVHSLQIDTFSIENDLNTPTSIWIVTLPLSLFGMVLIVVLFFPTSIRALPPKVRKMLTTNTTRPDTRATQSDQELSP
jgi:hypothetical protein